MTKTIISTEEAIEKIVKICKEKGKYVTIATDLKGFNWYVEGEISPHEAYIAPKAVLFEKDLTDIELVDKLIYKYNLTFKRSGAAGFYYFHN